MENSSGERITSRRAFVGAASAVSVSALGGCINRSGILENVSEDDRGSTTNDGSGDGADSPTDGGSNDSPAGLPTVDRSLPENYRNAELKDAMVSGGPGKDGIPAIDDPEFTATDDPPSNLGAGDPVFGVAMNGEAKAYPQYVLVWHEIVNDVVGGESIAVTYCPLTGTSQGFYRGGVEFGVSGKLINSNLVMYDRATDSLWPQMLAAAISGPHEGAYLEEFQVIWTTWEQWREQHPETVVLTEDTGYVRNYGGDPYGQYNPRDGYYADDSTLFGPLTIDDRFNKKDVVLGTRNADGATAIPKAILREELVIEGATNGVPYITVYDRALDTGYVYRNPDNTTVEYDSGIFSVGDDKYGPSSLPLEREIGFDAMWFAWYGYYPSTEVHG